MNKRTVALTDQQYIDIITAIKAAFVMPTGNTNQTNESPPL